MQKILVGNKIDGEKPRKVESRLAKVYPLVVVRVSDSDSNIWVLAGKTLFVVFPAPTPSLFIEHYVMGKGQALAYNHLKYIMIPNTS